MKRPTKQEPMVKCAQAVCGGVDSHKWENKVEILRLVAAKPATRPIGWIKS